GWLRLMADRPIFSYAEVPYRFKSFEEIARDPRNSLRFDDGLDARLRARSDALGGDGRLRLNAKGRPEMVTLLEKLLVPALAKVANLVPEGGIWMNTQRPEWNDANNALAGHGLSMVTLYQLRDYADWCLRFVETLESDRVSLSSAIAVWCEETNGALVRSLEDLSESEPVDDTRRWAMVSGLGGIAERARDALKEHGLGEPGRIELSTLADFFRLTRHLCDHSIERARRDDGLYESYRVMHIGEGRAGVERLAPMLEGQVSVLAAGVLDERQSIELLDALFDSELYREDQQTFILYPRVDLPPLSERNRADEQTVLDSPVLAAALQLGETRLVVRDADGAIRFNADLTSRDALRERLDELGEHEPWTELIAEDAGRAWQAYERTFRHARFTGRSGTMHKYEGLGSVYWHMVSKLMLAVQETVLRAADRGAPRDQIDTLLARYRRVRDGLGFRKSPREFGAVPFEPYSHTPWSRGAQQPGMTGQVKEGVLARAAEMGVRLSAGTLRFDPTLIDPDELLREDAPLAHADDPTPAGAIGCTVCGVPITVAMGEHDRIVATLADGQTESIDGPELPKPLAESIFRRDGRVLRLDVTLIGNG
ncbi:MAG: hypothetical protein AAGF47_10365, partial [Planctomycetota bacterium]